MQIALGIWRAHFDLAFVIEITLWNSNRANRFENQIIFLLNFIRHEPVGDATRNYDVIFRAVSQFAENRFKRPAPFEDEDDFVCATVLVILELCRTSSPVAERYAVMS